MTKQEFMQQWAIAFGRAPARILTADTLTAARAVEHVTIVGDGEDFHSSDRARQLMEVGYWGTLDVGSVS